MACVRVRPGGEPVTALEEALAKADGVLALCVVPDLAEDESPNDTVWECPSCHEYCGRESDEETPDDRLCMSCTVKRYETFREVLPDLARALKAVAEALEECDRLEDRGAVLRIRAAIARNLTEGK